MMRGLLCLALTIALAALVAGLGEAQQFVDMAPGLNLPGGVGAAWGDYNADGYPDMFLAGNAYIGYGARLLRNDGSFTFTDVSESVGISTTFAGEIGPAWADYDGDGLLDVFVGSDGPLSKLYHNEGSSFVEVAEEAGITAIMGTGNAARTAAWCDYDGDNDLDLFVCYTLGGGIARLFRNNGDGTFGDATEAAGMSGEAQPEAANCCAWADYDNDGWMDLLVTRTEGRPTLLLHNNGDGTFSQEGASLSAVDGAAGVAWADYDNDGWLDIYITSGPQQTRDWLFHNNGDGTFTDVAASAGMAGEASSSDSVACADYDNDGRIDIYVGNTQTGGESLLYHNNGDGTFTNVAPTEGMAGTYHDEAAAWADADLDGRIDLLQAGQLISRLFHNVGPAGSWLRVRTLTSGTGDATDSAVPTRDAIGARVELSLDNDDGFPSGRTLTRLVDGGSGFLGQNEQVAHFGVDDSTLVCVRACFPDGSVVTHRNVLVDRQITIRDVPADRTVETFDDVPLDYWAYAQIQACYDAGIVGGFPDGTYRPTEAVDRASMAVYISRALAGGDEHIPTGPATPTFTDVPADHWAYQWVEYAVANDIVQGYSPTTYAPDVLVDRGQMSVFIARAIVTPADRPDLPSYTPPDTPSFSDVATDHWAYKYIEYIAQDSVAVSQGYEDGTYRPDVIVTRDQMAVYVQRAFDLPM